MMKSLWSNPQVQAARPSLCYDVWWQSNVVLLFSFGLLGSLFAAFMNFAAQVKISIYRDVPMWSAVERRTMVLIDLIQQYPSWVFAYLLLAFGLLGWLLVRRSSWIAVWLTFAAFALPVVLYTHVCVEISMRLIVL